MYLPGSGMTQKKKVGYPGSAMTPKSPTSMVSGIAHTPQTNKPFGMPSGGFQTNALASHMRETRPETTPATQGFNYNVETDPAYLAAKRRFEGEAQTATNNAAVSLGSRGIGNSQSTVTSANQLQLRAVQNLNDTVVPQLQAQAYQRYNDEQDRAYQLSRDQVGDKRYTDETAYNHGRDAVGDTRYTDETAYNHGRDAVADKHYNDEAYYNHGRDAVADKRYSAETTYNHGRDKRGDFVDDRAYNNTVKQQGIDNYYQGANYNLSKNNSNTDNTRQEGNDSYNRLMGIWQATGLAPKGMEKYGVIADTPYSKAAGGSSTNKDAAEQDYNDTYAGALADPGKAYTRLTNPDIAKAFIAKFGPDKYNKLLKAVTPVTP